MYTLLWSGCCSNADLPTFIVLLFTLSSILPSSSCFRSFHQQTYLSTLHCPLYTHQPENQQSRFNQFVYIRNNKPSFNSEFSLKKYPDLICINDLSIWKYRIFCRNAVPPLKEWAVSGSCFTTLGWTRKVHRPQYYQPDRDGLGKPIFWCPLNSQNPNSLVGRSGQKIRSTHPFWSVPLSCDSLNSPTFCQGDDTLLLLLQWVMKV